MKVRFNKLVAVDYNDVRLNEVVSKSYYRNQSFDIAAVEENVTGYLNLHLDNGDLIIGVPKAAVDIIK